MAAEPLRWVGADRAVAFGFYARAVADAWSALDLAVYTPSEFERGVWADLDVVAAIATETAIFPVGRDVNSANWLPTVSTAGAGLARPVRSVFSTPETGRQAADDRTWCKARAKSHTPVLILVATTRSSGPYTPASATSSR